MARSNALTTVTSKRDLTKRLESMKAGKQRAKNELAEYQEQTTGRVAMTGYFVASQGAVAVTAVIDDLIERRVDTPVPVVSTTTAILAGGYAMWERSLGAAFIANAVAAPLTKDGSKALLNTWLTKRQSAGE